jgi:hypothetical protein
LAGCTPRSSWRERGLGPCCPPNWYRQGESLQDAESQEPVRYPVPGLLDDLCGAESCATA